jgi:hypothetical protein
MMTSGIEARIAETTFENYTLEVAELEKFQAG